MKYIIVNILFYSGLLLSHSLYANPAVWTEVSLQQRGLGPNLFQRMPEHYSLYQLDEQALKNSLNTVARSNTVTSKTISIPLPNKDMIELVVDETSVMAAELAAKYPQIKTYKVTVVDRPTITGVIDRNELGFHAMLWMENGQRLFIDPRKTASGQIYYISYYDNDYHPVDKQKPHCEIDGASNLQQGLHSLRQAKTDTNSPLQRSGTNLRTYRLAMATTGEYTTFFGGTVAQGLSAIATTIARVNQILERDLAVKLELVANNDQIVFTNAATDPFVNTASNALITQNQITIDAVIGSANYDIGHVFSQSGGGLAQFEAVCFDAVKAEAMTGSSTPENDPFDIDFVAHEIGHQFGANHSFNAKIDGCNPRNAATAWEIGNGITIMGYAGICADSNNVLQNSIAMFHIGNIQQMSTFVNDVNGGGFCGTSTSLANQQPSANAGNDFTIPAETPFQLTGISSDADSDSLTHTWEQIDVGGIANISEGDKGDNPLFRSFLPSSESKRIFPQLSDILNNTQTTGEILPTTSRNLNFTFAVRDQKGGVADDNVKLTVVKTSTPFKITSHTSSSPLSVGASTTVTWNVADTDTAPINCSQVDISLSVDGGNNFNTILAQNSSNDGSETVTIPSSITANSHSRFKVACSNNIFFDISDVDLSLTNTGTSPNTASATVTEGNSTNPTNFFKLAISSPLSTNASVTFTTRDGTATVGRDYNKATGTATIKAGDTEVLIGVTIIADTTSEPDETFSLVISNPINGIFPSSVSEIIATHTIINDD